MLGVALSASFCCAGAGMVVSSVLSPPPPDHYSPDEETQLLASEPYSMLSESDGPAWYVYLYDPDCSLCRVHLPRMQRLVISTAESAEFRVATIDIFTLESETSIPSWSWGTTPIMLVIEDGKIVDRQQAHDFLDPGVVSLRYTTLENALHDPLVLLEALPGFAPARSTSSDAWLVLIVSEQSCNTVREQVSMFRSKVGQNETLGILVFESDELEAEGIEQEKWGAACTGVLYRGGKEIAQYTDEDIPDPFTLWINLQSGILLPAE